MLIFSAFFRINVRWLPLLFVVALLSACGNKGDLYLVSDAEAARELEEAAEKLKKQKKTLPAPPTK